jgi:uncharacterized ion transporter superfamily protein YfcC
MSAQHIILPDTVTPKSGVRTSSFVVWVATLIVGGLFTYLMRRGAIDAGSAETHRPIVIQFVAEALPYVYFAVVGWLGKVFMKMRGQVSMAKAEALNQIVASQVEGK